MNTEDISQSPFEHRSHSSQGLMTSISNPMAKFPLPPRMWITDISNDSSDSNNSREDEGACSLDKSRVRSRFRHKHKSTSNSVPVGFFWDIENCQIPRGCSAIDVVAAFRSKFLNGRREADFVVVCDVRKELPLRLQELNDSQVSLIHVCGTQKNAADEKLRQCMRRFGEMHSAPACLVLISGDINFAGDLSDFRYRKNMEVILVHQHNTSSALIACATSHYNYYDITSPLPRKPNTSQSEKDEPDETPTCELEVDNLPLHLPSERVSRRLKRLADNCGGKVIRITPPTATLRFPTPDQASRALKRMNGEDVFGRRISTRNVRSAPVYSSDEGYGTAAAAPAAAPQPSRVHTPVAVVPQVLVLPREMPTNNTNQEWTLALKHLPKIVPPTIPQSEAIQAPAPKPRIIRGTHGSNALDQSGSSFNSNEDSRIGLRETASSRAVSPWNSSASISEQSSDGDNETAELTVTNLPTTNPAMLQNMLIQLFSQYVPVLNVMVWSTGETGMATAVLKSEWDARLLIAKIHKRRLDNQWAGRRLELSLGRPSPALSTDILRARLRAILLDQPGHSMPLLRLRDAYASRHCCALSTSDIVRVRDMVVVHENFGRVVQLINPSPTTVNTEETAWRCNIHGTLNGQDDGMRVLAPVYIEMAELTKRTQVLLANHNGMLPLLSFVDCYEAMYSRLEVDFERGVPLELLLRSSPALLVKDTPLRHITWNNDRSSLSPVSHISDDSARNSRERDRPRTAPCLEAMLSLFEREIVDLLKTAKRCTIQFSKLIPAFHHHFGRQCRVADYGFTKLPDLLAALSSTVVVLGTGSSRVITLSTSAQARRWTSDLVKVLKTALRPVSLAELPQVFETVAGRPLVAADYGLCTLQELLGRVPAHAVQLRPDRLLALPRRVPSADERLRTVHFAAEALELLRYTPNLRMEFAQFVPAYHTHFGRQLRVGHYGCVKLLDLFELIPETVSVRAAAGGERAVHLAAGPARAVMRERLAALCPLPLAALPAAYAARFGAAPQPDVLGATSLAALLQAAGARLEGGAVRAGAAGEPLPLPLPLPLPWLSAALAAAAVLSSDRSVAKGSTMEFFSNAFKELFGSAPNMAHLESSGVISYTEGRVTLSSVWRTAWRIALLLATPNGPLSHAQILDEYTKRYEPTFPCNEIGFTSVLEFVRYFRDVFVEDEACRFSVCPGVMVPHSHEPMRPIQDFSIYDTPPGQKGSRVFESPIRNIWSSPPANALPLPTGLVSPNNKPGRTRLAAQFNM